MKHLTKVLIISFLFSVFYFLGFGLAEAQTHPYFIADETDFKKIKDLIAQGKEPWKKQYDKLIAEANGIPDQPDLWDLVKLQNADWDEYKNKADNGSARLAKLALAYILSGDSNIYAKAENHLLGWTNESYLRILDHAFTTWNHSHPLDSLVINIALAYDWMYGNANFSQSEKNQVLNWLNDNDDDNSDDAVTFIKERHEAEYRSSNQKAWDNTALILSGLALNDSSLISYTIDGAENATPGDSRKMHTKALIQDMTQNDGSICDSYYGCKELWHSLLTLNAFSLLSSAAAGNGYENLFSSQAKLVKSFEFYAPVYQTNDINSLGEGFGTVPDWLYFSGVYEIAYKYLPNNSVIKSVLSDPDFNEGDGRYCENGRSQCSRWTKYPNLIWGQDLSAAPPTKKGDLNNDGRVDIFDYNLLVENFGNISCGNVADIDGNCKVDIFDYNILVENFGKKA